MGRLAFLLATALVGGACGHDDAAQIPDGDAKEVPILDAGAPGDGAQAPERVRPGFETTDADTWTPASPDAATQDPDGGSGAPLLFTVKQGCALRAERFCTRLATCSDFKLREAFGRPEVCRSRWAAACEADAAARDTGHTPFTLVLCAQELERAACPQISEFLEPEACRPPGMRPEGRACGGHTQCATGFCEQVDEGCGTCRATRPEGSSCAETAGCLSGLRCGIAGICISPSGLGASCSEDTPCPPALACLGGQCQAPLTAGMPCSGDGQCAHTDGLLCLTEPQLTTLAAAPLPVCRVAPLGTANQICRIEGRMVVHCPGGRAACVRNNLGEHRCLTPASDGGACGANAGGRTCVGPARCVAGVCRLAPLSTCEQ